MTHTSTTSKVMPALTALTLILGTTALTAPAFASATEQLQDDVHDGAQGGGQVPQPMIEIALDDVKAPEQSSGGILSWFGFGSKPVVKGEIKAEETPMAEEKTAQLVEPVKKSGGWFFGWGSSPKVEGETVGVTADKDAVDTSLPNISALNTQTDDPSEKLAKLESQLALYAKKRGRPVEDLTMSIFQATGDPVDDLTRHVASTSLNDNNIQFDDAGKVLRRVTDINGVVMPVHTSLQYFVEHKNKGKLQTTWFDGSSIDSKLMASPEKKYTFLKVARKSNKDALLWQKN